MGQVWIPLWPLAVACLMQIVAAAVNLRTLFVPNNMTLAGVLAGWLLGAWATLDGSVAIGGNLTSTISATLLGGILVVPFYALGQLGAGCVKMQAAFGAWVGCALGVHEALFATALATVFGVILTCLLAYVYCLLRVWRPDRHRANLFPAQVSLAVGSIAGLVLQLYLYHCVAI